MAGITVRLCQSKVLLDDCANCEHTDVKLDLFEREVEFGGPLTEEQRQCLTTIANRCPLHRTLTCRVEIRTQLL